MQSSVNLKSVHVTLTVSKVNVAFTRVNHTSLAMAFMECLMGGIGGTIPDNLYEVVLTNTFTRKISKADLKKIRLRYIPEYIRELTSESIYWKKNYRKCLDPISLDEWKSCEKQVKAEVKKHKTILKNLDIVRRMFVVSDDENYFSESLDRDRVQAMVNFLKANQGDDEIFYTLTRLYRGQKNECDKVFYLIYATWSLYGEFRVRPSRRSSASAISFF